MSSDGIFDSFREASYFAQVGIDKESEKLIQQREALRLIEKNLSITARRVKCLRSVNVNAIDGVCRLNIGGKHFDICRSTTLKDISTLKQVNLLAALLADRWGPYLLKDKDGRIYFDFEPEWIVPLLDYMRTATRFSLQGGQKPPFPKAFTPTDQLGLNSVLKKFRMEGIFTGISDLGFSNEGHTTPCFRDPFCREAMAGYVKESLCNTPRFTFALFSTPSHESYSTFSHLQLLYRGSRDGFTAPQFHSRCDNKGSTITIIRDSSMNIFGGVTDVPWSSRGGHKASSRSCLFLLEREGKKEIMRFPVQDNQFAVYHNNRVLCAFGNYDLVVYTDCDVLNDSYTNLGCSYHALGSSPHRMSSGLKNYRVEEIEVYSVPKIVETHHSIGQLPEALLAAHKNRRIKKRVEGLLLRLDKMRAEVEERETSFLREVLFVEEMVCGGLMTSAYPPMSLPPSSTSIQPSPTASAAAVNAALKNAVVNGTTTTAATATGTGPTAATGTASILTPWTLDTLTEFTTSTSSSTSDSVNDHQSGTTTPEGAHTQSPPSVAPCDSLLPQIQESLEHVVGNWIERSQELLRVEAEAEAEEERVGVEEGEGGGLEEGEGEGVKEGGGVTNVGGDTATPVDKGTSTVPPPTLDDKGPAATVTNPTIQAVHQADQAVANETSDKKGGAGRDGPIVYFHVCGQQVCIRRYALLLTAPNSLLAKLASDHTINNGEGGILVDEAIECFRSIIAYLRLKALRMEEALSGRGEVADVETVLISVPQVQEHELTRMLDFYDIEAPYVVF